MKRLALTVWFVLCAAMSFAAAVPFLSPGVSLLDNSGQPLAGGHIWTYAAGTSALKTSWSDSGKSSPNTNPVVLDAYGRANVFCDGTYKIIITDVNGVTLVTVDNLVYADPTSLTTGSFSTLSVTSLTVASASIGGLSAANPVLSNPTTSNGNLNTPTITSPTISSATINGGLITSATVNISGGTIASATITALAANLNFAGYKGTNIATPTIASDVANKGYVDNMVGSTTRDFSPVVLSTSDAYSGYQSVEFGSATWNLVGNFTITNSSNATRTYAVDVTAPYWCASVLGVYPSFTEASVKIALIDPSNNVYDETKAGIKGRIASATTAYQSEVDIFGTASLKALVSVSANSSLVITLAYAPSVGGSNIYFVLPTSNRWYRYFQVQ